MRPEPGPGQPTAHLYTISWNEAAMLGFFFRHYDPWISRYIFFDDGSTDGTPEILAAHPRVEVRRFVRTIPDSFVLSAKVLQDSMWKESRGQADWVVITAVDEHLHHPELERYLGDCTRAGVTMVPALGYQMVAEAFPAPDLVLGRALTRGAPDHVMSKLSLFRPDALEETDFGPGRHTAAPVGRLRLPARDELLLLHYKYVGRSYARARQRMLATGLGERDIRNRWGRQYLSDDRSVDAEHARFVAKAVDIARADCAPDRDHVGRRWWREGLPAEPVDVRRPRPVAAAETSPARTWTLFLATPPADSRWLADLIRRARDAQVSHGGAPTRAGVSIAAAFDAMGEAAPAAHHVVIGPYGATGYVAALTGLAGDAPRLRRHQTAVANVLDHPLRLIDAAFRSAADGTVAHAQSLHAGGVSRLLRPLAGDEEDWRFACAALTALDAAARDIEICRMLGVVSIPADRMRLDPGYAGKVLSHFVGPGAAPDPSLLPGPAEGSPSGGPRRQAILAALFEIFDAAALYGNAFDLRALTTLWPAAEDPARWRALRTDVRRDVVAMPGIDRARALALHRNATTRWVYRPPPATVASPPPTGPG